jgi:prepilin-type processing-associated H-X9-DG protein
MTDYGGSCLEGTGMIVYGFSPINFASVIDGLSNSLLAGDKRLDLCTLGQFQSDDNEGYSDGWDWDVECYSSIPPLPDQWNCSDNGGGNFGGSHPGGFNALMGDGSVRVVTWSVSQHTMSAIGTISGGEVLDGTW